MIFSIFLRPSLWPLWELTEKLGRGPMNLLLKIQNDECACFRSKSISLPTHKVWTIESFLTHLGVPWFFSLNELKVTSIRWFFCLMKALNSRINKKVLEERLKEARKWKTKLFRELIFAFTTTAPVICAILRKFIFQGDSLIFKLCQSKCSTVPAGNRQMQPSPRKCESNLLTVRKFFSLPSFVLEMNTLLKNGISFNNSLTTNFKSGLILERQKRSTNPSPMPRGWLETTNKGQPVGIWSNPSTLILLTKLDCFNKWSVASLLFPKFDKSWSRSLAKSNARNLSMRKMNGILPNHEGILDFMVNTS